MVFKFRISVKTSSSTDTQKHIISDAVIYNFSVKEQIDNKLIHI